MADFAGCSPHAFVITPSDTEDLSSATTGGIWVGGTGGNVTVTTQAGDKVAYTSVPGGTYIRVIATRVWQNGTNASDLVGQSF